MNERAEITYEKNKVQKYTTRKANQIVEIYVLLNLLSNWENYSKLDNNQDLET